MCPNRCFISLGTDWRQKTKNKQWRKNWHFCYGTTVMCIVLWILPAILHKNQLNSFVILSSFLARIFHGIRKEFSLSSGPPLLDTWGDSLKIGAPRSLGNAVLGLSLAGLNEKSESDFGPWSAKSTSTVRFLFLQYTVKYKKLNCLKFFTYEKLRMSFEKVNQ